MKTLAQPKATITTMSDLYGDCLLSILDFGHPLEIWFQRSTCSRWHEVVPVALSRTVQVLNLDVGGCEQEKKSSDEVRHTKLMRRVADLCPNLKTIGYGVNGMVRKNNFNYEKNKR